METSTTIGRGTYSPEDNKLRIYPDTHLDEDTAARLKAEGFRWAPGQKLFVAPAWTPAREDLVTELCGSIQDEAVSLAERAEQRAEKFTEYAEHRNEDAAEASGKADRISSMRPLGQPILVGHHSEGRARRDLERVLENTRKAVKFWDQAQYWERRAEAAVRHAHYKSEPTVRARRIKELEKQLRAQTRCSEELDLHIRMVQKLTDHEKLKRYCLACIRTVGMLPVMEGDKAPHGLGPDLIDILDPGSTAQQKGWYVPRDFEKDVKPFILQVLTPQKELADRWVAHYTMRLDFERAMLRNDGGIPADAGLEVGGAIRAWCSPEGGYCKIIRVNPSTVRIATRWSEQWHERNLCKTKIREVLSKERVEDYRKRGALIEDQYTFLIDASKL